MSMLKWVRSEQNVSLAKRIEADCGLSGLVSRVLAARCQKDGSPYLYEDGGVLNLCSAADCPIEDPYILKDMDKAVQRIRDAIDSGERIAIYGDYDADGITATTVVYNYLLMCGADVQYFIPTREGEGYALSKGAIDQLLPENFSLIITVDNGISCVEEVEYANSLGLDVVVTDHHQPGEVLPNAVAVVDPHRPDCPSTFKELAGVGVAFKLVCALEGIEPEFILDEFAPFVAIGTVADVMPLVGENKLFVSRGLEVLPYFDCVGLSVLLSKSVKEGDEIGAQTLAFTVVPRINAPGRMGDASEVVHLFTEAEEDECEQIVDHLFKQNNQRQDVEADISAQIDEMAALYPQYFCQRVIVLCSENWHKGIVGIVSSRVVDKYHKPCILLVPEGNECRGSGRSYGEFDLFAALGSCSDILLQYGGHKLAAGLSISPDKVDLFRERINAYAKQNFEYMPMPELCIDTTAAFDELTLENVRQLELLGPFGNGNPRPNFELRQVEIAGIFPICEGKHVRLKLKSGNRQMFAVYFRMSSLDFAFRVGDIVDVAVTLDSYKYLGEDNVSIKVKDINFSKFTDEMIHQRQVMTKILLGEPLNDEEFAMSAVTRDHLALVYKALLYYKGDIGTNFRLYLRVMDKGITYPQMRLCLAILVDLGIVKLRGQFGSLYAEIDKSVKSNIQNSKVYQSFMTTRTVNLCQSCLIV